MKLVPIIIGKDEFKVDERVKNYISKISKELRAAKAEIETLTNKQ